MRIGILGSGLMGGKLGTIFARAGHEVVFSYARSEQKLKTLARNVKGKATHGTPREAAQEADAILLAVHWSRMDNVLHQAGDLSGKAVVTCSLPMNERNTELVIGRTSSGAEELKKKLPKAHIVVAFNTVPSEVSSACTKRRARPDDRPWSTAATTKPAKRWPSSSYATRASSPWMRVLYGSRDTPFALLIGELAYGGAGGPELAYRFERFGQRD